MTGWQDRIGGQRNTRRIAYALVAAMVGVGALAGCSTAATPDATPTAKLEPFNALNISDFSGAQAQANNACKAGYDTAALVLNKTGGILGHEVVWRTVDTAGNLTQATALATRELQTPPAGGGTWNYIQSGGTSDEQLAELPAVTRAKVIGLGVQSAKTLGDPKTFPYHFSIGVNYNDSAEVQTEWLKKGGYKKVGLLYLDSAVGLDSKTIYEASMKKAGLDFVSVQYAFGQTDVSPEIQRLQSEGVDVVLWGSQQGPTVAYVLQSREKLNFYDAPFLGDVTVSGTNSYDLVGADGVKNLYLVLQAVDQYKAAADRSDAEKAFYDGLKELGTKVEVPIHVYAACYDELMTMNIAAEQAKSIDPDKLKAALEDLKIPKDSPLVTSPDGFGWTADTHLPRNPKGFYVIAKAGPVVDGLYKPLD